MPCYNSHLMVMHLGGGSTEETRLLWRLAGMGFQFGTEIIAGVLLGWLVDRWFGTAPWGVLTGSLIGIAVAMTDFIRKAVRLNREMDREAARRGARQGGRRGTVEGNRATPRAAAEIDDVDEDELTHEQWKVLRDRELEPNTDDGDSYER